MKTSNQFITDRFSYFFDRLGVILSILLTAALSFANYQSDTRSPQRNMNSTTMVSATGDFSAAKIRIRKTMSLLPTSDKKAYICEYMPYYSIRLKYCVFTVARPMNAVFLRPGLFITSKYRKVFLGGEIKPHLTLSRTIMGHNYSRLEIDNYQREFRGMRPASTDEQDERRPPKDMQDMLTSQIADEFYPLEKELSPAILGDNKNYDYLITLNREDTRIEGSLSHELLHAYLYALSKSTNIMDILQEFYGKFISERDEKVFATILAKAQYDVEDRNILLFEFFSYVFEEFKHFGGGHYYFAEKYRDQLKNYLSDHGFVLPDGLVIEKALIKPTYNYQFNHEIAEKIAANLVREFGPDFNQKGLKFIIENNSWLNHEKVASIDLDKKNAVITVSAQLIESPFIDSDLYTALICHEIGHALGGVRQRNDELTEFSDLATEGEADYFSTLKCTKRLWSKDNNQAIVANLNIPDDVRRECLISFPPGNQAYLCMRNLVSAFRLFKVGLSGISQQPVPLAINDQDRMRVGVTLSDYPESLACRYDTLRRGALCNTDVNIPLNGEVHAQGACTDSRTSRPRCWYNPIPACNRIQAAGVFRTSEFYESCRNLTPDISE